MGMGGLRVTTDAGFYRCSGRGREPQRREGAKKGRGGTTKEGTESMKGVRRRERRRFGPGSRRAPT
jgi:hypothetical protein